MAMKRTFGFGAACNDAHAKSNGRTNAAIRIAEWYPSIG
jgi:hypothetical protein